MNTVLTRRRFSPDPNVGASEYIGSTLSYGCVHLLPVSNIPPEAHRVSSPNDQRFTVAVPGGDDTGYHVVVTGKLFMAWTSRLLRHWAVGTLEIRDRDGKAVPGLPATGRYEIVFS